ncbi:MAG: 2-amino-4-hydroxy-6-hydroxymethyldihydropteridine diphosphokinase [Pseudomonadota bacterium]
MTRSRASVCANDRYRLATPKYLTNPRMQWSFEPNMKRNALQTTTILVALGANQPSVSGQPRDTLERAITLLESEGIILAARSSWYRTPAYPAGSGPDFVNGVISLDTDMPPLRILALLHRIETMLGRVRGKRWGPRICDLDLLAHGAHAFPERATVERLMEIGPAVAAASPAPSEMIVPHPRLHERAFVLVPLCEIAPAWVHPISGQTATELLTALPAAAVNEIERLDE